MYRISWSDEAKANIRAIYDFIKPISPQGAKNVIADIRKAPKSLVFSEQYRVDEYTNECRRIVVRNYKVLYTVDFQNKIINIVAVFNTRQDPAKLSEL